MRKFINFLTGKVSALIGTARIKNIYDDVSRIKDVTENILIERFLQENLFQNEKYKKSKKITHFHKSVFTQNGEDGIIEEIFSRIGVTNKYFVEFGVHEVKNNSTYLLVKDWSGLWIVGNEENKRLISSKFKFLVDDDKLTCSKNWITKENIEQILIENKVPRQFDFLSIDLDGNDYWIWEAITQFSPRVVCIEYNATFPPSIAWKMKYNEAHIWDESNYFGASLMALEILGKGKGYELIGCDYTGCNAFFVRNDQDLDRFDSPFTAEHHYETPRYYLKRSSGHKPGFGPFEQVS